MEEDMAFGVVADMPATYVAFDTLNELGAEGVRVIQGDDVRTDSWGAVTDLLGAR